jgi:hypothetical protein
MQVGHARGSGIDAAWRGALVSFGDSRMSFADMLLAVAVLRSAGSVTTSFSENGA